MELDHNHSLLFKNKQQILHQINSNNHSLSNSGRLTPLRIDRTFDSKRYMRVDDLDLKKRPGRLIIPSKLPEGLKEESSIIDYRTLPKQQKLLAQQGRLPFTRRYTKEKYGEDSSLTQASILYHINQTDKDHDPDMCTRRFKAEIRRTEPNAYSSQISNYSMQDPREIPSSHQSRLIEEILKPKITHVNENNEISKRSKKSSKRVRMSNRKFIVNSRDFNKLPVPPSGYEYFEEVSVEDEESEEEKEFNRSINDRMQ
jgi:hypothetical protein